MLSLNVLHTEPVLITSVRLSDRSPDEGLGSSIAAPQGSLRSSLSCRIESNDTDRSVDIIEGSDADRAADVVEGGETDLGADVPVDVATVADDNRETDAADTDQHTEGIDNWFYLH